jgi:hypothetical protein
MLQEEFNLKALHKQQEYSHICELLDNNQISFDSEWDFVYSMNSLYKLKRYNDCLVMYRKCKKVYPESEMLNDKMGWSVYYVYIKNFDFENGDKNKLIKQVNYVINNCKEGQYSPRKQVINTVIKAICDKKLKAVIDYELLNKYLDCLNPDNLSTIERRFESDDKIIKTASEMEEWYSKKTKALCQLELHEECIDFCNKGLEKIRSFHHDNDSWFKYRKACALYGLKRYDEAKTLMENVVNGKFIHWCLFELLFKISASLEDNDAALKYIASCALTDKSHEMRVTFYDEAAQYMLAKELVREAQLHHQLSVLIRIEKGWKIKNNEINWEITEDISTMPQKDIVKELKIFWKKYRDKDKIFYNGTVDKILDNTKAGFIKSDSGERYFFLMNDVECRRDKIKLNTNVSFTLVERINRKKGTPEKHATVINLL